ncbi:MAG: hypothetical protein WA989_09340 [Henriciella sp.]|uniref:hypothetical protein n=1 Tax=Henriciella sp. TaxID=1968823 RepID=UPI003C7356FC
MSPRHMKWFMRGETALNPFLCHADDGSGDDDKGGGGGGADDKGGGADDKGGGADDKAKGSLGDRLKGQQQQDDKGKNPLDKVDPPKDGAFDLAQIPEAYRGKDADETLGKMFGKLKEYETAAEARGKAPERAEDYPLKLSETAAKFFNPETDPVIAAVRKIALKQGMGSNEFQSTFGPVMEGLVESGLIDEPLDLDKEVEKLGEDGPKLYSQAEGYIQRQETKLKDLAGNAKADMEDVIGEMKLQLETASGIKYLNYVAGLKAEQGPGVPGDPLFSGEITRDKIRKMRQDPRFDTTSREHDPDYRKRVDELARQVMGG